jgi:hypothetical protein
MHSEEVAFAVRYRTLFPRCMKVWLEEGKIPETVAIAQSASRLKPSLMMTLLRRRMDSPLHEISCLLCSKPVDLRIDLSADENGKAVHTECYVKSLTNGNSNPSPCSTVG